MSNEIKKIDFVFLVLEECTGDDIAILNNNINKLFNIANIGNIHIYTNIKENKFQMDSVILHTFERYDTGDALLSVLRNRNIPDDFVLCTKISEYADEVLSYIMDNSNTLLLVHKENPRPVIKLDEFNRVQSVGFESVEGFGYESFGIFRMNKKIVHVLVQTYHLEFYNSETQKYVTHETPGFDILDLFNHTNWGLFTFDIYNILNDQG